MKSLLAGLLVIAALGGPAYAASTGTMTIAVSTDVYVAPVVPVEEKVVEIHMTRNVMVAQEQIKKRNRRDVLPYPSGGTCSGEFINNGGDILTARHCVDGFDEFEVQTFDRRLYTAVVVATSAAHDLAMLHIDRRNTAYFELAETAVRGQKVYVLGSPLGITDTLSTGVIAKINGDVTLLDCSALPGNSGGPVFDSDQKLVGVLNAGYIVMFGVTHLNMAQGLDAVHYFIKEALEKRNGRR